MKTYSAQDLRELTEDERLEIFRDLGIACYGSERFHSKFARDSGWSRRTFWNWTQGDTPIPIAAILLLQEWSGRKTTPEVLLTAMGTVSKDMENIAKTIKSASQYISNTLREERQARRFREDGPAEQLTAPEPAAADPVPEHDDLEIDVSRL